MPPAGKILAGEDLGQRGLPRAVATDQADAVARSDPEGDVVHQQARTGAHLELGHSDHDRALRQGFRRGWGRRLMGPGPAGYVSGGCPSLRASRRVKGHTCASTRRPGSTRARSRPAAVAAAAAAGCGCPSPAVAAAGGQMGIGTILVIVLVVVLRQCMGVDIMGGGGSTPAAGTRRPPTSARPGRTRTSRTRARSTCSPLRAELLEAGLPRARREAVRGRPDGALRGVDGLPVRQGQLGDGALLLPQRPLVYLDTDFFDDMLQGELGPRAVRSRSAT